MVNYGKLMHEIFSTIKTKEDIDAAVSNQYFDGKLSTKEQDLLKIKIKSIVENKKVSDWFSNKWIIRNEDAILNSKGERRIPDRVLFSKTQTVVIDFKFGEKHKEHTNQVKEYIDLLKEMKYPDVKGFLFYAEKNLVEEVLE